MLAHVRFQECEVELRGLRLRDLFTEICRRNLWAGGESVSGLGSALAETERLRRELPNLLTALGVRTILDLPCGDFAWMRHVDLGPIRYIGGDIVEDLITRNRAHHGQPGSGREFLTLDVTNDPLPTVDLVLSRDCLVHLSFANIFRTITNVKRSGSRHLLTTTFLDHRDNEDAADGDWRLLNLERPPFNLPPPLACIVEGCTEQGGSYADKALGLWEVSSLP